MKIVIKTLRRYESSDIELVNFIKKKSDFKLNDIDIDTVEKESEAGVDNRINELEVPGTSNILSCIIISNINFISEFNTELFTEYKEFMNSLFKEINIPLSFSMSNGDEHYFISVVVPEYEGRLAYSKIFWKGSNGRYIEHKLESFFIKNIQTEFNVAVRDVPEGDTKVDVVREKTIEEIHDENADYVYRMLIENKFDDEENITEEEKLLNEFKKFIDEPDADGFNFDNVEMPKENNDVVLQNKEPDADGFNFDKYEDEEYRGDEGFDELDEPDNSKQYEEINIQIPEKKKSKKEIALKVLDTTYKVIFIAMVLRKLIKRK